MPETFTAEDFAESKPAFTAADFEEKPTPTGPPEVSTLPEQSVQLGGGRPAPPAQSFGAKSVWQNVTTPVVNYPPEAIAQQLRFNPSQPAIGMALAALPPKLREDIIKGVSEGVAQNVVDPFLSPLGAGTMLAGGAIPKVAQKAMQIGFGVLGGMGVPGTLKRLGQAKSPGEASKELIGLGAEAGMVVGGVKGGAEVIADLLPRTKAALSQVKPTTERPENATQERQIEEGVQRERERDDAQRVPPETGVGDRLQPATEVTKAPNAPEGQARNVLERDLPFLTRLAGEAQPLEPLLAPEGGIAPLYVREWRAPEESPPTPSVPGKTLRPEVPATGEVRESASETIRRSNARTIQEIQDLWPYDETLNREKARTLGRAAWGQWPPPKPETPVKPIQQKVRGKATTADILPKPRIEAATELDALQTIRDAGMPLSDQQQARLSELEKAAAPPPVRPEGEPTRVAAAAATTEPSGPGAAVTAAPPAASVSEATTSQQVKQVSVEKVEPALMTAKEYEPIYEQNIRRSLIHDEATGTLRFNLQGHTDSAISAVGRIRGASVEFQKVTDPRTGLPVETPVAVFRTMEVGTGEAAKSLIADEIVEALRYDYGPSAAAWTDHMGRLDDAVRQGKPFSAEAWKEHYGSKRVPRGYVETGGIYRRVASAKQGKEGVSTSKAETGLGALPPQAEPQTAPEGGATKGAEAAAAQPDFVGLGAAAAGEETGRPTIGELIPSRAGTAPTPAPTTAESSVLQRVGQLFSRESMRDTGRALAGTLGTVLGKTLPKITKLNRLVGELGARYISSRIYARYAAPIFSRDVMAGLNIDPVKFGAALSEDNLRSIKEAHLRKASESTNPTQQARLNEMANNVFSFVGERGTFRTESEYQDYLRRPEVQEAIRRHISNWKAVIEPQYREAMMLDPELELPERGLQTGARVNLAPVLEGRPIPPGAVWSSRPGSLLGTLRRKSPFGVLAKGTGEAYIPNYDDLIANTFFKQTEIANKNAFDKALVEQGLAVIDKPGQHPVVGGEQTVAFPLTRRTVVIPGEGAVGQNQMIYVRRSLAKEYRVASNVDANPYEGFIATKINNAFSQAALAGLTDATVHVSNLSTSLAQLPVSKLSLLTDTLLSAAIRSELPVVAARAIKKGGPEVAGGLLKRSPLLKKITPDRVVRAIEDAYWKNQTQLASLAEIGALKEPHVLSNLPPLKQMSQLIQWYDRTTRMVLDDAYTDLAQRGVVENTETARREFINQVGQYNKRAQGAIVRFFRQSGLGPFITAGRAFNVLGARAATLSPGVKATSPMMALALRVNALAKWTGTLSFVALMNYLITGKTTGTPGTPIGSISSKDKDELGRNKSFSVINLTGQGRALRVTGLRGFIEAKRKGLPTPVAEDAAMRDIVNSAIGPMAGPAIRGAFVAATGQAPAVSISRVSRVVPPGESQTAENIKTALLEANPVIAGAVESGKPGKSWKDAVARQLPRFTMQVTQPERMIQDYPIIVRKAQANAYIDDVIHRARRIENSQERWKFITDSILKLSPEDQAHAWLTIRFRKVE